MSYQSLPEHLRPVKTFAGETNPAFLCADGLTLKQAGEYPAAMALSDSEKHRLVKASKSPTHTPEQEIALKKRLFDFEFSFKNREYIAKPDNQPVEVELERENIRHGTAGCQTVIEFREWEDAYRLRTQTDAANMQPPEQSGKRESELLTERAARKIAESCEYMAQVKGGYKTFVTGTFAPEVRERIDAGETTIQKEVSRTMDALQKMYQRGWIGADGERLPGNSGGLPYCWVVEIPKNEDGTDNPHVHMLLGWSVPYRHFKAWAARIESIWSNGYFHLEKIKASASAGAYMAKAAGYMTKGQNAGYDRETGEYMQETQGRVQGNRYGISAVARAPGWVVISRQQLHTMGQLIADVYDHLTVTHGEKYQLRKKLNKQLEKTPKSNKSLREKIGRRLEKVRAEIKKIPVRCNKYQVVIKGKGRFYEFMLWATTPKDDSYQPEWLPEKPEGAEWRPGEKIQAKDGLWFAKMREQFSIKKFWRRLKPPHWMQQTIEEWNQAKSEYEKWANAEPIAF